MYHLDYQNQQWLILSLGAGLVLVLLIALGYLAVWRPREESLHHRPVPPSGNALKFIPWVLIVVYVSIMTYYFISPLVWLYWPEHWS